MRGALNSEDADNNSSPSAWWTEYEVRLVATYVINYETFWEITKRWSCVVAGW